MLFCPEFARETCAAVENFPLRSIELATHPSGGPRLSAGDAPTHPLEIFRTAGRIVARITLSNRALRRGPASRSRGEEVPRLSTG
jgi:hypothetical protein